MNITLKPFLLKRRKKKDGRTPVYMRITQNRRCSLLYADVDIQAQYWKDNPKFGSWIKPSHPSSDAYNNKIKRLYFELESLIDNASDNLTRKQLVKLYRGNDTGEIQAHAVRYAKEKADEGKYSSQKQIKSAAYKFEQFTGRKDIRFDEITPKKLNKFQKWMKDTLGNHPNTIRKTMSLFKEIYNNAYEKDLANKLPFQNPKYKPVKSVETKKTALSKEQMQDIEALDLEPESWQWHVRNFFLFSFWNAGIRFTDLALLRWKNIRDGRLKYEMGKNDKEKDILLMPQAKEILKPYKQALDEKYEAMEQDLPAQTVDKMKGNEFIFPIIDDEYRDDELLELKKKAATGNTLTNRALKKIAKQADIQTNVTFHISRHSFARWADSSDVMERIDIQKMLAHSKMETTERYLASIAEYNADEKMKQLAADY